MHSDKKNKSIDIKVEIIRIIACIAVIWYHIRELPWKLNGELNETAVFFECICTICVMTFFFISGFFIYNKSGKILNDWKNIILSFLKTMFLPFILVVIFTIIFHDFLISKESLLYCIKNFSLFNIFNTLFVAFIDFSAVKLPGTSGHLWYFFSYMIIIFAYPLTRLFLTKLSRKIVYTVLVIITIIMVINDFLLFDDNFTLNIFFDILHKPIYYSAIGYVLYNDFLKKFISNINSNKIIINYKIAIASFCVYAITFILLFITQCKYCLSTNGEYVYTSWLSTFSIFLTLGFVVFIYNINFDKFVSDKVRNIILYFSNKTLYIYLIHYLVITKLLSIGFQDFVKRGPRNIFEHFAYYIIYSLIILVITFIIIILLKYVINFIKKIYYKFKRR